MVLSAVLAAGLQLAAAQSPDEQATAACAAMNMTAKLGM